MCQKTDHGKCRDRYFNMLLNAIYYGILTDSPSAPYGYGLARA
jgi:hypothetical protein